MIESCIYVSIKVSFSLFCQPCHSNIEKATNIDENGYVRPAVIIGEKEESITNDLVNEITVKRKALMPNTEKLIN